MKWGSSLCLSACNGYIACSSGRIVIEFVILTLEVMHVSLADINRGLLSSVSSFICTVMLFFLLLMSLDGGSKREERNY